MKEIKKSHLTWLIVAVIVIAVIVLPTGTPEDAFTTVPLLGVIGWKKYALIAGMILAVLGILYLLFEEDFKRIAKKYQLIK